MYDHVPDKRVINFLKYDNDLKRGVLNNIYPEPEGDYGKVSILDFEIRETEECNVLQIDFLYSEGVLSVYEFFPILSIMDKNKPIQIYMKDGIECCEDIYNELKSAYPNAVIMKGMDKSNYYIKKYIDDMFKKYPRETILKIMKESIIKQEKEGNE